MAHIVIMFAILKCRGGLKFMCLLSDKNVCHMEWLLPSFSGL